MKILIVGLGSMGKRRARLIKGIDNTIKVAGVDFSKERREEAETLGITAYESISAAVLAEKFDAAFVSTAPKSHSVIISELLDNSLSVFTEINLISEGYEENIKKAEDKNVTLFLSSTMLYRGETQFIKNEVDAFQKPVSYIYHIGQYLPDWHPWENYKNFFVGDKRTGGCREIFGIELPWILDAFGDVTQVHAVNSKLSELEIDYPDSYLVTLIHKNGTKGQLAVDIVSPKAVRSLEVFGEGLHLFWEGNPKELYKFDFESKLKNQIFTYTSFEQDPRYSDNIVENAYVDEIQNFFGVLSGKEMPRYTFEKDFETLKVIDTIEG